MNPTVLKSEVDVDPLGRGYSGMTDQQVADSLNDTDDREQNIDSLTGDDVFQATASAAWALLTADEKIQWLSFTARNSINPFGSANVQLVTDLFGPASVTLTNLQALRKESITRSTELGLGFVHETHVAKARTI